MLANKGSLLYVPLRTSISPFVYAKEKEILLYLPYNVREHLKKSDPVICTVMEWKEIPWHIFSLSFSRLKDPPQVYKHTEITFENEYIPSGAAKPRKRTLLNLIYRVRTGIMCKINFKNSLDQK